MPGPLTDLLEYLDGIGYRDLYLRPAARDAGTEGVGRSMAAAPSKTAAPPQSETSRRLAGSPAAGRRSPDQRGAEASSVEPGVPSSAPVEDLLPPEGIPAEIGGRVQILAKIAQRASTCHACGLCRGRQTVVFGSGHPNADLMLIGEGPGGEEDRRGLPFVGPAGELLNKIIGAIDESREGVYIANVVKCRPPNNRDPLPEEVAACRPYLEAQIDLVQPKVLVALGRVAAQALLQSTQPLRALRGTWHEVRGIPTRATYHPAALLRNAGWKRPTWEDMKVVRDRLRDLQTP